MKQPIHEADIPWEVFAPGTPQELHAKPLCDVGGRAKIGVGLLELPPGSDTRRAHWHSLEEEHLFVLAGEGVLRLGQQEFPLRAGSYVTFPAGQAVFHHLENRGAEPFRYLMIGERIPEDRVTHERSSPNTNQQA
jgi:uncharacterized cupin superfamily protein